MTIVYNYNRQSYDTVTEVEAAVTELKTRLDNNPTDWCTAKLLSGNAEDGWVVPSETLSDSDILNPVATSYYNLSAVFDGTTYTGISGIELTQRVNELRVSYANWIRANTITKIEEYSPSNEDMSGYV
jgi:hypothetical protein